MSAVRLDTTSARNLSESTEIVIVAEESGDPIERVTIVRYAGHYRTDAIEAFVVRDHKGKVKVRSDRDLGLDPAQNKIAYVAETYIDLTTAS